MHKIIKYITPFFYKIEDKKTQIRVASGAGFLYFMIAFITPHLIPLLELDSYGYLDFSEKRTAFYPLFLDMMQAIGLSLNAITIVQSLIFSIIFSWLIFHLMLFRMPLLLVIGFYLGMVGNIYLTAFHFSILTESLGFSLVLLLMIYVLRFIHHHKTNDLLMMAVFAAIAVATKPASLAFCVGVLISGYLLGLNKSNWKASLKKTLLVGLLPIIFVLSLENIAYYAHHDKRTSITPNHLFAKATMLTLFDGFDSDKINNETYRLFSKNIEQHFLPAKNYVSNIDNFCLRAKTYSEYEVYAQYKLLPEEFSDMVQKLDKDLPHFQTNFAKNIIMSNLGSYAKLTTIHYFAFFCGGASQKLANNNANAPIISADGTKTSVASQSPLIIYYVFLLFGAMFFALSIIYSVKLTLLLLKAMRHNTQKRELLTAFGELKSPEIYAMNLLLWVHGYHLLVALTGLVIPRYLMVSYPMIILALLLTSFAWLEYLRDYLNKSSP